MRRIIHVGMYHHKDDIRILYKECNTLAKAGYDVSYVTSDYYGDTESCVIDGIKIKYYSADLAKEVSLGIGKNIFKCLKLRKKWALEIVECILEENPDVVHIHEYELIFIITTLLKRKPTIKLVYDIHEDNPKHIADLYKKKMGSMLSKVVELIVKISENSVVRKSELVFVATNYICDLVRKHNKNVYVVKNYPKSNDICCYNDNLSERENVYCYSGRISEDRGISILVKNSNMINGKFLLAGIFDNMYDNELQNKYVDEYNRNVDYRGYLSRKEINQLYSSSVVGLCTLHYHPNYINALPIKLFEYMAAGIPAVVSDFPLWKEIVNDAKCGILVDPYNEEEIVNAVNLLLSDRELAKRLGDNGKRAIKDKYSWEHEGKILLEGYRSIL